MQIAFRPQRRDDRLTLTVSGDVLTVNGEAFDFSGIPEGATLPRDAVACDWLAGPVERQGGEIWLTLILPHGARAPSETLAPSPVTMTDGSVPLPPSEIEQIEPDEEENAA
jgi:hypothetical protein